MKKTFLFVLLVLTSFVYQVNAQYFIRDYNFITPGFTQDYPVDMNYHAAQDIYLSLHHTPNGKMNIVQYDGTGYGTLSYISIYKGANTFEPVKMVHYGNYTTVLFSLTGTVPLRYGLVKYDHTTNTIAWAKSYVDAFNGFDIKATGLAVDNTGSNVFVVGNIYNTTSNMGETYLSCVNSSTGALNWHQTYSSTTYSVDEQHSIYYHSNNDIYIGANSYTTPLNRSALILHVNSSGMLQNNMLIAYNSPCTSFRLAAPYVKRLNNDVYVFCPSVVGADGSGDYFWAKLNSTITSVVNYKVFQANAFYFYGFYAPEFEFVNNNTRLMVSGIRSYLNSSTAGYMHAVYDLNFNLVTIKTYQNQNVGMYATPIFDAYKPATNLVFSVAQDAVTTNQHYGISTDPFGNIFAACETPYAQTVETCTISGSAISMNTNELSGPESNIRLMKLDYIEASVNETCTGCPTCPPSGMALNENNLKNEFVLELNEPFIQVYPNPSTGTLYINTTVEDGRVEIYNLPGVKVGSYSLVVGENTITMNELAAGEYILKVLDEKNTMLKAHRIVLQK
ncbi:MAG TPA: T9SS type A sorting domain-containing protein [Flavobacteriales bacterium]|nr:T9SS type A sorting domain-containing protein [Flavobacteriales bacterium]